MNGWKEWNGGEMPVDPDTWVDFVTRGDDRIRNGRACDIGWQHQGGRADVIRYRANDDRGAA